MQTKKRDTFDNRLTEAAKARQAMLERFNARPRPDDPAVLARQAEMKAVAEARDARVAERKRAREAAERAEAERLAAERAAAIAAEKVRVAEAKRRAIEDAAQAVEESVRIAALDSEKKTRALAVAAEQKASRDARYAARKARQRK